VVIVHSGCASLDQFGERSDIVESSEFGLDSSDSFATGTPEGALLETYDEWGPPTWFAFTPPPPSGETTFRIETPRFLPVPVRPAFYPHGKTTQGYVPPPTQSPVIVTPTRQMVPPPGLSGPQLEPPSMPAPTEPPAEHSIPPVPPFETEGPGETLPLPAPREASPTPTVPTPSQTEPSPFEPDTSNGAEPAILTPPTEGSTQLQWRRRGSGGAKPSGLKQPKNILVGHQE